MRTLIRLVESNPLLFGGLPAGLAILASKCNQGLGDLAEGTLVVTAKQEAPSRRWAPPASWCQVPG